MDTLYLLSFPLVAGVLVIIKADMSAPDFYITDINLLLSRGGT